MSESDPSWPRVLWQSALLAPLLLFVTCTGAYVSYRAEWWGTPRWHEAWRHDSRLFVAMDRWVHYRFVHPGAQYWMLPVDFSEGPITLRGTPPDAAYWSVTWYEWTEAHPTVGSEQVELAADGTYEITMSARAEGPNAIPVRADGGRGVIYLRIYDPEPGPVPLPTVLQNGQIQNVGGWR